MSSNYQQKKMMNALGTPLPAGQRAAVLRGYRL